MAKMPFSATQTQNSVGKVACGNLTYETIQRRALHLALHPKAKLVHA
jgi:hypothetical protein